MPGSVTKQTGGKNSVHSQYIQIHPTFFMIFYLFSNDVSVTNVTRQCSCNAKLHGMMTLNREHLRI
jgi:hypothetical protein